jgi:hypothetical protein
MLSTLAFSKAIPQTLLFFKHKSTKLSAVASYNYAFLFFTFLPVY